MRSDVVQAPKVLHGHQDPSALGIIWREGLLEVIQNGKLLGEMHAGTAFGELAILYNCKRTATVKALSEAHIWALDRQMFQTIMRQTTQARHEEYFSFLRSGERRGEERRGEERRGEEREERREERRGEAGRALAYNSTAKM
ncbi:cGMP-dependent protein kinase 2 [Takifugu flavidus]|uniref:cGMP-dependent protein kinase 2 n=1 Tax=Takifugu flavidus TaxID=433684 RepID=A0A5C6PHL7_9TELE|nr:cGMP-dependent protein kinase 2 [Takifugu flavidus]